MSFPEEKDIPWMLENCRDEWAALCRLVTDPVLFHHFIIERKGMDHALPHPIAHSWDKAEKRRKQAREYYQKNKEKVNKRTAEWRKKHPERAREIANESWRRNHPNKCR